MRTDRTGKAVIDLATATGADVSAALARWDQLEPRSLAALGAHPAHGPRLRVLRAAEAWLDEQGPGGLPAAVRDCPDAGELFAHGGGRGHAPLDDTRRAEIDRHLLRCADCRRASPAAVGRPPSPLDRALPADSPEPPGAWRRELDEAGGADSERGREVDRAFLRGVLATLDETDGRARVPSRVATPTAAAPPRPAPRRRRSLEHLLPLAAAASLVAAALWLPKATDAGSLLALPQAPLLRGVEGDGLVLPSGPVLFVTAPDAWHGLTLGAAPRFECSTRPGATAYRVEVFESGDAAFDTGRRVAHLLDSGPLLAGVHSLAPGGYTWQAWAEVDGLRCELGERDFQVVPDRLLEAELEALAGLGEPARTVRAVRLLHEAGFLADARELARRLPSGPERDAYLGRTSAP
jgi:hypothetical protein